MARKSLIAVLAVAISLSFIGQGFCQSGKKTSSTTTTEKKFTAIPDKDGNKTTFDRGTYTLNRDAVIHLNANGGMNIVSGIITLTGSASIEASIKNGGISIVRGGAGKEGITAESQIINVTGDGILYNGTVSIKDDKAVMTERQVLVLGKGASITVQDLSLIHI